MDKIKKAIRELMISTIVAFVVFFVALAFSTNAIEYIIAIAIGVCEVYILHREYYLLQCEINAVGIMMLTMREIIKSRGDDEKWQNEYTSVQSKNQSNI